MASEIVMPRLGWTMEEGSVAEWLKKDGDQVAVGEIIFTVEGDKAINEIESFESGILRILPDSPALGVKVPIGALLAYLVQPGERAPFETATFPAAASGPQLEASDRVQPGTVAAPAQKQSSNSIDKSPGSLPTISPRAKRVAAELAIDWSRVSGSGRSGRIVERDIRMAADHAAAQSTALAAAAPVDTRISPVARRAAEVHQVDLDTLAATLPGKRIEKEDVVRVAAVAPPLGERQVPMSSIRQITSERMLTSVHSTAPVTLTTEIDATELVKFRKQFKQKAEAAGIPVPGYTDLLTKLLGEALADHPALNARLDNDQIVYSDTIHVGFAVDTDRGLFVPVVRDVQTKSVRQIARESAALIARAREGKLTAEAMSGGTFTITNLGMYEIDAFTPIINLPQCAILGVGRIVAKQVVIDTDAEKLAIRHMMCLSLTFDHRLVDGGPAARFLKHFKQLAEAPDLWLA